MPTATITTMLDDWRDAERSGDAARLGELLTDNFVGIGPVGFVLSKDAWLGRLGPGQPPVRGELHVSLRRCLRWPLREALLEHRRLRARRRAPSRSRVRATS